MRNRFALCIAVALAAALLLLPSMAGAQCGDGNCSVGAAGTGGEQSEGKAQGFHTEGPSTVNPRVSVTNVGNNDAGRIEVSGDRNGTLAGTFRGDSARGHGTGAFGGSSGEWSGQCDQADFPDAC